MAGEIDGYSGHSSRKQTPPEQWLW